MISRRSWVPGRSFFSSRARSLDPEAATRVRDPLYCEHEESVTEKREHAGQPTVRAWLARLRGGRLSDLIAPYMRSELRAQPGSENPSLPLLARYHADVLGKLDGETRRAAGQVFRRILMAEEYLLRYLTDVPREGEWVSYLVEHYTRPLKGHTECLRDRVQAYLETLARASENALLLEGYRQAATNLNVVQLVKGGMRRDRYFLGFNTPYRPEILIATSVGQEGIDLHRECRVVIHHDLCWNPATIEQRTGRVDRIGSKVERERASIGGENVFLEIAAPYLAATYDERMFIELYRRAQLFEVTLGGDYHVDGKANRDVDSSATDRRQVGELDDEDFGEEGQTSSIDLPEEMVARLRVNLAVWSPDTSGRA